MSTPTLAPAKPKLLDRVSWHLRVKHYSIRTEQVYIDWIRRYILFHRKRHPEEMGEDEIAQFLTHLAVEKNVAASTQNQALSALLFLYQQVLERKLDFIDKVERVQRPPKIPVVFTRAEARAVLARLKGDYRLMAHLLYGSVKALLTCCGSILTYGCSTSTFCIRPRMRGFIFVIRATLRSGCDNIVKAPRSPLPTVVLGS